jgi:hypothetical protein
LKKKKKKKKKKRKEKKTPKMMKLFSKHEEESQVQSAIVRGQYRDTVTMTTLCGEIVKAHDEEAPRLRKYVERQLQTCDVLAHFADVARQQPAAPRLHDNAASAASNSAAEASTALASSSSQNSKKKKKDSVANASSSDVAGEKKESPFALYAEAVRHTAALKRATADAMSDLGDGAEVFDSETHPINFFFFFFFFFFSFV